MVVRCVASVQHGLSVGIGARGGGSEYSTSRDLCLPADDCLSLDPGTRVRRSLCLGLLVNSGAICARSLSCRGRKVTTMRVVGSRDLCDAVRRVDVFKEALPSFRTIRET